MLVAVPDLFKLSRFTKASFKTYIYQHRRELGLISLAVLVGACLRWWLVKDGNVLFWFDQARDALTARDMYTNLDLKIQGPSASGTSDSVHHGVLYYYLIAPLYWLFSGNPISVSIILGWLSLLTIWPISWLTYRFTKSKLATATAVIFFIFSLEASQSGTWLSNPTIAITSVPFFFFFLWRVFWEKRTQELPWLALALAISNQAVIYTIYLFGALAATWLYFGHQRASAKFTKKQLFWAGVVYLLGTFSMVLNQLLLMYRGIFDPLAIGVQLNNNNVSLMELVSMLTKVYLSNLHWALFPTKPMLSFLIPISLLFISWSKLKPNQRAFFVIWLTAPLWILGIQVRNSYHTLLGIMPAMYILIPVLLYQLKDKLKIRVLTTMIVIIFIISNLQQFSVSRATSQHVAAIQLGTALQDKLALIDYTYQTADGEPFSISSFASPYLYNTTWSYLYSWYGQQEYGYVPVFWGADQTGMYGEAELAATNQPLSIHFALLEPSEGILPELRNDFLIEQNYSTVLLEKKTFGTMEVQLRKPTPPASASSQINNLPGL